MIPLSWPDSVGSLGLASLRAGYASRSLSPVDVVAAIQDRIASRGDDGVWISLVPRPEAIAAAASLDPADRDRLPLWGMPFAVKDNIDVAGMETTAACPDFAYEADTTASAVTRLLEAGAILIGKTNLDQFATGLNGTRSPYGIPTTPFDDRYISGGSSSGSAVAVSCGLVSFSLGTDTAGSGRVPAALTNVVGMKPSFGLVDTDGVLPACRSLDCVSVFALTVPDGAEVLDILTGSANEPHPAAELGSMRLGIPDGIVEWGDLGEEKAWTALCDGLRVAGAELVPIDMAHFFAAGDQLYGGPWLAERLAGLESFVETNPGSIHPVVLEILERGANMRATEVFESQERMRGWRTSTGELLAGVDALLTPTVTGTFRVDEVLAEPIRCNNHLGRYTTFTNLLGMCGVAVPVSFADGMPFGVTVQAAAGRDTEVAGIAAAIEDLAGIRAGAVGDSAERDDFELAVVGAHLEGQPLHEELLGFGARLVERTTTAASYRLFALRGTQPAKPGLEKVAEGGAEIAVEVYALPSGEVGGFLATVRAPLAIGQIDLVDGRAVHGFVCEPLALSQAEDISVHRGWRAYLAAGD